MNLLEIIRTYKWHTLSAGRVAEQLESDPQQGLSPEEALQRQKLVGANTLIKEKKVSFWKEFFEELCEPMVLMLLVTGVLYIIWGELADAITIFVIILTLNTVEVLNEMRSKKAIASLRKLAEPLAAVRRAGSFLEIPVEQVVPGDLIVLQTGHRIPADARLVESVGLTVDESALTGESMPVEKNARAIHEEQTALADRSNLVFSSTLVTRGKGTALVIGTGMETEIGRIAGLAREVKEPRTPLQQLMSELSKTLVWFAVGFSVLVPLIGIFIAHQPAQKMLLTGLSLAFATIPEELPIIITMVLALGSFRLSKNNAIAKRLNAVESLGSVTVIATDKTGTLTQNRMQVQRFEPLSLKKRMLEIGVLCNDAIEKDHDFIGDPIDTAILRAAAADGMMPQVIQQSVDVITEFSFDNDRKRMSILYQKDDQYRVAVKGAPETLLALCESEWSEKGVLPMTLSRKEQILNQVEVMAVDGLRVIALAERNIPDASAALNELETDLVFVGLIGFADPPRLEVPDAIEQCKNVGIRTIMITGDHPATARMIASQIGLDGNAEVLVGKDLEVLSDEALQQACKRVSIFARTAPEHKLRIVQALQKNGERVAVTGDGINDAPALAAADIGVAMGETGTDAAREAGDIVLADDNFTTIVGAVREGRLIYENLKKGVRYYLACKVALILITLLPTLLLVPVPFAPVQIILMELFMDLMAAASFVSEKAEADLLDQRPRDPQGKFMDKAMVNGILSSAAGLFVAIASIYLYTWYGSRDQVLSQTVAFYAWLIGHVFLAFNMRSERQPIFQLGLGSNRLMLAWAGGIVVFLLAVSILPSAQQLMKVTTLTGAQWGMILVATFVGTFWAEIKKMILYKK